MKKLISICAIAATTAVFALTGCGGGVSTYAGEYSYNTDYGVYGVKVSVQVQNDIIKSVKIVESDYTEVTESWEGSQNYYDNKDKMLASFEGKKVSEVKGYTVVKQEDGAPASVTAEGLTLVTGATQSSGRLILAVQNALSNEPSQK